MTKKPRFSTAINTPSGVDVSGPNVGVIGMAQTSISAAMVNVN